MIEFIKEFWEFLKVRKKYWLLPIIIVLALFGILIVYGTPALRKIPLFCAEKIADLAVKNKYLPIVYLFIVFIMIPAAVIFLMK